jgi:hypothetical protein
MIPFYYFGMFLDQFFINRAQIINLIGVACLHKFLKHFPEQPKPMVQKLEALILIEVVIVVLPQVNNF